MSSPRSSTESYLGSSLNSEDTTLLVGKLVLGLPRKVDQGFAKHTEENKALEARLAALEFTFAQYKKENDERFTREYRAMQEEFKRNIAAIRAERENKVNDEGLGNTEDPFPGLDNPSTQYVDPYDAKLIRRKMQNSAIKSDIELALEDILQESLQVTARSHTHWLNDGSTMECFIAIITSAAVPRSDRRKVLLVGPLAETELRALRGLKAMAAKNYPAAVWRNYADISMDSSEDSDDGQYTPPSIHHDHADINDTSPPNIGGRSVGSRSPVRPSRGALYPS